MTQVFGIVMAVCAVLAASGGVLALATIRGALVEVGPASRGPATQLPKHLACSIDGPVLAPQARPLDSVASETGEAATIQKAGP